MNQVECISGFVHTLIANEMVVMISRGAQFVV